MNKKLILNQETLRHMNDIPWNFGTPKPASDIACGSEWTCVGDICTGASL